MGIKLLRCALKLACHVMCHYVLQVKSYASIDNYQYTVRLR